MLGARPHRAAWSHTALQALVQRFAVLIVVLMIVVLGPLGCVIHCAFVVPLNPPAHPHAGQQSFFCRTHQG